MRILYLFFWFPILFLSACFPNDSVNTLLNDTVEEKSCVLSSARYPVQSVAFDKESQDYEMILLGAPSCIKQPYTVQNIQIARIEKSENGSNAILDQSINREPILYLTSEMKISLRTKVIENGEVVGEQSSVWMPFLASAAGGMVAGALANKMFSRPQHYSPPSVEPGQKEVRGFSKDNLGKSSATSASSNFNRKEEINQKKNLDSYSANKRFLRNKNKSNYQRLKTKARYHKRKLSRSMKRRRR